MLWHMRSRIPWAPMSPSVARAVQLGPSEIIMKSPCQKPSSSGRFSVSLSRPSHHKLHDALLRHEFLLTYETAAGVGGGFRATAAAYIRCSDCSSQFALISRHALDGCVPAQDGGKFPVCLFNSQVRVSPGHDLVRCENRLSQGFPRYVGILAPPSRCHGIEESPKGESGRISL